MLNVFFNVHPTIQYVTDLQRFAGDVPEPPHRYVDDSAWYLIHPGTYIMYIHIGRVESEWSQSDVQQRSRKIKILGGQTRQICLTLTVYWIA